MMQDWYIQHMLMQHSSPFQNIIAQWRHGAVKSPDRVFSRDVLLGGKLLLWGEKMWRYPKKQTKFVIVWGENSKLRGEISPPKGPEKKHCLQTLREVWLWKTSHTSLRILVWTVLYNLCTEIRWLVHFTGLLYMYISLPVTSWIFVGLNMHGWLAPVPRAPDGLRPTE